MDQSSPDELPVLFNEQLPQIPSYLCCDAALPSRCNLCAPRKGAVFTSHLFKQQQLHKPSLTAITQAGKWLIWQGNCHRVQLAGDVYTVFLRV